MGPSMRIDQHSYSIRIPSSGKCSQFHSKVQVELEAWCAFVGRDI